MHRQFGNHLPSHRANVRDSWRYGLHYVEDESQHSNEILEISVADPDPDPDPVGSGLFWSPGSGSRKIPDPDPGKYRIRILCPQKDPMLFKFSRYKIVQNTVSSKEFFYL